MITVATLLISSSWSYEGWASENRGKVVFERLCTQCHGASGEGVKSLAAPSIAGLPQWYLEAQIKKFQDGVRGTHGSDVAGMRMRPMALTIKSAEELSSVVAHVAQMPRPAPEQTVKGSPVKGEEKFKVCQTCHAPDGKGNQALNAPPLVGMSDWYLVSQLRNFRAGIRGADASRDPNGASMRGMAATLDEQGDLDVVSYINMLNP